MLTPPTPPTFHRFGSPARLRGSAFLFGAISGFAVAERSAAGRVYRARLRGLTEQVTLSPYDPRVEQAS